MVQDVAFQVGSSTWLNYFISLEESSTPENLLLDRRVDTMKQFAPNDSDILALAKTSISVSMVSHLIPTSSSWILKVRHPFERLVSAYQNKVRWICLDKVDILGERGGRVFTLMGAIPMNSHFLTRAFLTHRWLDYTVTYSPDCWFGNEEKNLDTYSGTDNLSVWRHFFSFICEVAFIKWQEGENVSPENYMR